MEGEKKKNHHNYLPYICVLVLSFPKETPILSGCYCGGLAGA